MADRSTLSIDRMFDALGDPSRRRILERLSSGPCAVSTLSAPLNLTLAAVLQHVQSLERCGLVQTKKVGRVRTCRLQPNALAAAEQWLSDRKAWWVSNFDRLGALLEEDDEG